MAEKSSNNADEAAPESKLVLSKKSSQASFIATAKDEVYKATKIVKKDATAVEHMAQSVEKLSRGIQGDVDHVESALHQMIEATGEEATIIQEAKANDPITPLQISNKDSDSTTKSSLTFEWPKDSISHVAFIFLTICIVVFHVWGDSIFSQSYKEVTDSNTLVTAKKSTIYSLFLIYIGTIWRVLKSFRKTMTREKDAVTKVEEKVHEIGQEVKTVAKDIEIIADNVEHKSHQLEEEASKIQSLVKPVE